MASVNGVTIDRSELQVALVGRAHEAGPAADRERLALEVLVADELAAQRAVQLGLGTAEQPRAQRAAAFRAHIAAAAVTDAEAAVWFADNRQRIDTEVRIRFQLSRSGVARDWEVTGWLRWNQVPAPLREVVYGLVPGQISAPVPGPNQRSWVVQVIERRDVVGRTFEGERQLIVDLLGAERRAEILARAEQELRSQASIVLRLRGRT